MKSVCRSRLAGGTPACSNFDYGARLTEMILLGNVALRYPGQRLLVVRRRPREREAVGAGQFCLVDDQLPVSFHGKYPSGIDS